MKLSCGVVPFRKTEGGREYLLLRCYRNWDFPKGMKDEGESPLSAAKREFTEETGIETVHIVSADLFTETEKYGAGKIARYYPGEVSEDAQVKLLPNPVTGVLEHQEFRWVREAEAQKLLVPRLQKVLDWVAKELPE